VNVGTRRALGLLATALLLGIAADLLGRTVPDRLSMAIWIVLALVAGLLLAHRGVVEVPRRSFVLAGPALMFAVGLVGRVAEAVFGLNLLAALSLIVLAAPQAGPTRLGTAGLTHYVRAAFESVAGAFSGVLPAAAKDIEWGTVLVHRRGRAIGAALAGFAVIIPVLLIFGSLLGQADPLFQRTLKSIPILNLDQLAEHVGTIAVVSWLVAGFLRWAFVGAPVRAPDVPASGRIAFPAVGTAIGAVAVLFLAFVAVEARYMFAGESLVRSLTGLSYAEYARRGFFELTWVTVLSLPLLLLADWLLDKSDVRGVRAFRAIAATVVLLLAVILGSAFFRMHLYVSAYGQTQLRFNVTVFMVWLAAALLWFAATVLRGRRERFATGAYVMALIAAAGLNLNNPDERIARTNLARAGDAHFDAAYLTTLSADALPVIESALPRLPPAARCDISRGLARRWALRRSGTDWNLSRVSAGASLARAREGEVPGCR
jgi:hypothetical protein